MKLGVALAGGGIRGICHAGVLKALEDHHIKIDLIGGTSSGSLIASLYAMGYSPYYIYRLFKRNAKKITETNMSPLLCSFILNNKTKIKGLKSGEELEELYNEIAKRKGITTLEDIKMPIVIPTVDISKSEEYLLTNRIPEKCFNPEKYITKISVGKAVRASSSIPVIFEPCPYETHAFMDGGALNNIPVKELKQLGADKVIAVKFDAEAIREESNVMDIVMKTLDIMGNKISEESLKESDYLISVYTDHCGLLDVEKLDVCFEYGYEEGCRQIEKIKQKIFG